MPNALIITDHLNTAQEIKNSFAAADWNTRQIDLMKFISHDNQEMAQQFQCALLYVDKNFPEKYAHLIDDVSDIIKSYAAKMPIYLTFEENYDHRFYWWRLRSKRVYETVEDAISLKDVIQEITKLENLTQNRTAYVSPMS